MNVQSNNSSEEGDDFDSSIQKLSALNNRTRFSILKILLENEKNNEGTDFQENPYYARDIKEKLSNDYDINVSIQRVGQHLRLLLNAGLVEVIEIPGIKHKGLLIPFKAYVLRKDGFEDLILVLQEFLE